MLVNERIKQVRNILNLSQVKFAKAIFISSGYLADIESNRSNINDRIIQIICLTFNVREEWLKTGNGEIFEEELTQLKENAITSFKKLRPVYQEYVMKQMDLLLEIQEKEKEK